MRYPQPDNEDDFEEFCLRLYRKQLNRQTLKLYAKRGEKQHGVDIHDPVGIKPVYAIQCKHSEPHKKLKNESIEEEVVKANSFPFNIDCYIIATTAQKSKDSQDCVASLNASKRFSFSIEIEFWEEMCQSLSSLPPWEAEVIVYGQRILAGSGPDPGVLVRHGLPAVEKLLSDRNTEAAEFKLIELQSQAEIAWLDNAGRYQLKRLEAKVRLERGDFETAGKLFLEAFAIDPESDQSKQNRVFGTWLCDRTEASFTMAEQYISEGLQTVGMLCNLVQAASTPDQIGPYWKLIDPNLADSEDLNLGIAQKYIEASRANEGKRFAKKAVQIAPDSAHSAFTLGMVYHEEAIHGDWRKRDECLKLAKVEYDRALKVANANKHRSLLPEIYVHRGAISMLMGNIEKTDRDYLSLLQLENGTGAYAARAATFYLHKRRFEEARPFLDRLDPTSFEARFIQIILDFQTADGTRKQELIRSMNDLGRTSWEGADECPFHAVQWAIQEEHYDLAEQCVDSDFRSSHPLQANTLLAWTSNASGNKETALKLAKQALSVGLRGVHRQELSVLAGLLIDLEAYQEAATVLEQVVLPGQYDENTERYLHAAQQLERHDWLLRICSDLRETGAQTEKVRRLELQLMSNYQPEKAFDLTDQFIKNSENSNYFRAHRNFLAARLRRQDEFVLDPPKLPSPDDLPIEESRIVALPYVLGGKHQLALDFLYRQLRSNFDEEHAHGQYIYFVSTFGGRTKIDDVPAIAAVGVAVRFETENGDQQRIVIENNEPKTALCEHSTESTIGSKLVGVKVGDQVSIPGLVDDTALTVVELQTCYLSVYQDSLQQFSTRFPGSSIIQQFDMLKDGELNVEPIISSLKSRREQIEHCLKVYRDQTLSISFFASSLNCNLLDAMQLLATHEDGLIKVVDTTSAGFIQHLGNHRSLGRVVLDATSLVTLARLQVLEHVGDSVQCYVSQSTSEQLDDWIAGIEEDKSAGHLTLDDADGLVYSEISSAGRGSRLDKIVDIRRWIDQHCKIQSSSYASTIDLERRELYFEALGRSGFETICLAKDLGVPVWADDLVLRMVAEIDLGVSTLWTQSGLAALKDAGQLSDGIYERSTAKLFGWKYTQTFWSPKTFMAAAEVADWDTKSWPLNRFLETFSLPIASRKAKARTTLQLFRLLRLSDCNDLRQTPIIQSLLDGIGDPKVVQWIGMQLETVFPLDFFSIEFLRAEIAFWLDPKM